MSTCSPAPSPERTLAVTALPSTRPGHVVVEVEGAVDVFTAPLLDACLHSQANRTAISHLVVDLRRVSFLSGAGIRAMAGAERLCRSRGAQLSVRCRAGIVLRALELGGLGDVLSVDRPGAHPARNHRRGRRPLKHGTAPAAKGSAS